MAEFADPGPDPDSGPDSDSDQSLEDTLAIEEEAACHAFEVRMRRAVRTNTVLCPTSLKTAVCWLASRNVKGWTSFADVRRRRRVGRLFQGSAEKKLLKRLDMQGDGEM